MLKVATFVGGLTKSPLSRSLPAFSTSSKLFVDPECVKEAPIIDNEKLLRSSRFAAENRAKDGVIIVSSKVDLSPISGVPQEHIVTRRVRIYQPSKNAMQSGTNNIYHWEMEFDNRQRWENPLMGWTSSGDPLSNLKVEFKSCDEAIQHCEKNGWAWFIDEPKTEKPLTPKSYGLNFSWNRRTRVSTK